MVDRKQVNVDSPPPPRILLDDFSHLLLGAEMSWWTEQRGNTAGNCEFARR